MARNLRSLATSLRKRAASLDEKANSLAVGVADAALLELVQVTPVDTSEAISGWQVGINEKPMAQLPPHFPGRRGSTRGSSSAKSIAEGREELKTKRPGQTIYLSNTAPHIGDLNRGTSTQFAGGFDARARIVISAAVARLAKRFFR